MDCMCANTKFGDTFQRIVATDALFSKFQFPSIKKQIQLFKHLKKGRNFLYKGLDADKRTLFLREIGDNFRAGACQPTKQMSFSILNLTDLINSPNGQFLSSIWRRRERKKVIQAQMKVHYKDVTQAVEQGLTLTVNGLCETFNVIAFFIADLKRNSWGMSVHRNVWLLLV